MALENNEEGTTPPVQGVETKTSPDAHEVAEASAADANESATSLQDDRPDASELETRLHDDELDAGNSTTTGEDARISSSTDLPEFGGYAPVSDRTVAVQQRLSEIDVLIERESAEQRRVLSQLRSLPSGDDREQLLEVAFEGFRRISRLSKSRDHQSQLLAVLQGPFHYTATGLPPRDEQELETSSIAEDTIALSATRTAPDAMSSEAVHPNLTVYGTFREVEDVLGPLGLSPETLDEDRHPDFARKLRGLGIARLVVLLQMATWYISLKVDNDKPDDETIRTRIRMLQALLREWFRLPRTIALQMLLLHVALMSRLFMLFGADRRAAAVESWRYAVPMEGDQEVSCAKLRDAFLKIQDSEDSKRRSALYEEFKKVVAGAKAESRD